MQHFIEDAINAVIDDHTGSGHTESWDFDALWTELKTLYPVGVTIDEVVAEAGHQGPASRPTASSARSSPTR